MSLCSRAQRPIGTRSCSGYAVRRRSVRAGRAVVVFGWEGMKYILLHVLVILGSRVRIELGGMYPVIGMVDG